MFNRGLVASVLGAGLLLLAPGCQPKTESPAGSAKTVAVAPRLVHVVFQTDWYAAPEHAGYYQALAKGYYQEAGLDVEIVQGGPGGYPMQKVATGQAQFAMGQSDDVTLAIEQKVPLLIVSAQLQHDPQAVFVHDDSPVRKLEDLNGRTVRAMIGASWVSYVKRHFAIDFKTVAIDYGRANFVADPEAIQQGYLTSDGFLYQQNGVKVRMFPLFESGYDPYRVIVANPNFVREHPEVVQAFVDASNRGWDDFMANDPRPAEDVMLKLNAVNTTAFSEYAREAMRRYGFVSGEAAHRTPTGQIVRARLARQLDLLRELGLLNAPLTVDDIATFAFTPAEAH